MTKNILETLIKQTLKEAKLDPVGKEDDDINNDDMNVPLGHTTPTTTSYANAAWKKDGSTPIACEMGKDTSSANNLKVKNGFSRPL